MASNASNPSVQHLLNLPEEILCHTFSFLDFTSLHGSILVCKHFRDLAEPFLYKVLHVLNGRQGSALSHSLGENHRRCSHVRNLLISTRFGHERGLMGLPPYIALMQNLHDLRLETPDCNSKEAEDRQGWVLLQDRYERVFEHASALAPKSASTPLPNLTSCTLHFVDSNTELYPLTRYGILFLHQNLRSLTISCASTDFPQNFAEAFRNDTSLLKSTNLEHLHLEECDLFAPTLGLLLSFPKALKSLKISEGVRYDGLFSLRSTRMHGNIPPAAFEEVVAAQCAETLESLSLNLGYFRHDGQHITQYSQHLNLTAFHSLKFLELNYTTMYLVRIHPDCDHQTWRRLPPNLETLKVFDIPLGQEMPEFRAFRAAYFPVEPCLVKEKARHGVARLSSLILSYEYHRKDEEPLSIRLPDGQRQAVNQVELAHSRLRRVCNILKPTFLKAGVVLRVEMVVLPDGFIPPYLYPEMSPESHVFWESTHTVLVESSNEAQGYSAA